ncbi:MAG: AmmeMemoRadiSam system protein B, partial [Planctomycetes bacterium]|nr:AmmeMemoRadiSam system protein B [Planctomycetota bacterium]
RRLRALVAPHIDFHRGGAGYGCAYAALRDHEPPEVVVLLGTGHAAEGGRFIATAKGFETPLGRLPVDRPILGRLEAALGAGLFAGEAAHRREHSLELQAVWLAHLFKAAPPAIVPIVATSFDDLFEPGAGPLEEPSAGPFLRELRATLQMERRRVLLLAGADFAHVGPRFGDRAKLAAPFLAEVRARDAAALAALVTGSAAGFLAAVAAHRNRDRICSVASLFALLFAADANDGALLVYDQAVDPEGELAVTYASAALYGDCDDPRGLPPARTPALERPE